MGKKGNNTTTNTSKEEKKIEMTNFSNLFDSNKVVNKKADNISIKIENKEEKLLEDDEMVINSVDDENTDSEIEEKKVSKKKKKENIQKVVDISQVDIFDQEDENKELEEEEIELSFKNNNVIEEVDEEEFDQSNNNEEKENDKEEFVIEENEEQFVIEENDQEIKDEEVVVEENKEDIKKEEQIDEKKNDEPKISGTQEMFDIDEFALDDIEKEVKELPKNDNVIDQKKDEKKVEVDISIIPENSPLVPEDKKEPEKKEEKPEFTTSAKHEEMSKPSDPKSDLLPKAQKNHLSDMIDQFNANNNTRLSTKDMTKYLQNQFFKGEGESVNDKRESFKKSYQDFCKEVYKNMLEKRNNLPANQRQTLEDTQKDFDALTQQIANVCKANGWMKKDFEVGPNGGLSAETMRKLQKDAIKDSPQNAKELIEKQLGKTSKDKKNKDIVDLSKNLDDFSKKFNENLGKVPDANKGGMDSPEAKDSLMMMQALDSVHASRTLGYRLRHPFLYKQEEKLLEQSKDVLQSKGYDREVINSMIKATSLDDNDMVKSSNSKDEKDIENLYKNNQKSSREFEEKIEKEQHELKQQIKGLRKKISVPEADTVKDIVNPKERSQRVELSMDKQMNLEFAPGQNK